MCDVTELLPCSRRLKKKTEVVWRRDGYGCVEKNPPAFVAVEA